MRTFPSWLISIAAIGLGFFGFVIAGGVFLNTIGPRIGGLPAMLIATLIGLVAAYFASGYSRRFMAKQVSKGAQVSGSHPAGRQRKRRIALALLFAGAVIFPVFIFIVFSSIINLYV